MTNKLNQNPTPDQLLESAIEKTEWSSPGHLLDEPLLLVEQADGSWKKPSGDDLIRLREKHSNFFKYIEPCMPEDW